MRLAFRWCTSAYARAITRICSILDTSWRTVVARAGDCDPAVHRPGSAGQTTSGDALRVLYVRFIKRTAPSLPTFFTAIVLAGTVLACSASLPSVPADHLIPL